MNCSSFYLLDDESGSEEETLQYYSTVDPNYRSRRRKKLDSQNKNSQSFLSVLLNVTHGLVSIFTDVKVRHWGWNKFFVVLTMVSLHAVCTYVEGGSVFNSYSVIFILL